MKCVFIVLITSLMAACAVVPSQEENITAKCELSSNKLYLKMIDVTSELNTYYSLSGKILSPILVPTTAVLSGIYVGVNNTYHLGEKAIKCQST